jgi:hypothetical protein
VLLCGPVSAVLAVLLQEPLWLVSIFLQVVLAAVVFRNRYYVQLPRFAIYVAANLSQAIFLLGVYARYGFNSRQAYLLFWASESICVVARVLAGFEVIARTLEAYRGVWGLARRLLAISFLMVLCYTAAEAPRSVKWVVVPTDRGFHLAFAVALVCCLVVIRHYCIQVPALYRSLLGGFCFYSCMAVLRNTVLQALFERYLLHFRYYQVFWDVASLLPFIIVQSWWAYALRKPAEASLPRPVPRPPTEYENLGPEINERLRRLNDLLSKVWKLRVSQS